MLYCQEGFSEFIKKNSRYFSGFFGGLIRLCEAAYPGVNNSKIIVNDIFIFIKTPPFCPLYFSFAIIMYNSPCT